MQRERRLAPIVGIVLLVTVNAPRVVGAEGWKKHIAYEGDSCATCVAGDFTGDGKPDIVCNAGGRTLLLVAPSWKVVPISGSAQQRWIHSEVMDVDGDGDLDVIGATYQPGRIVWLEQPKAPTESSWEAHLIDDQINGVHGLLVGDVDGDSQPDLLANSAQPTEPFPRSLIWYGVKRSGDDLRWARHVFAKGDAPGLSHYLGLGDVNGDGRADAASAAKGGPMDPKGLGNWFAWWEAPANPTGVWSKHVISDAEPGATNIHPADVNGDGVMDFVASRGHGRGVVWFEGPQWRRHDIHATLQGPHCLVVCDLDADGDLDAATCAKDEKLAVWFENDGQGRFKTHLVAKEQAAYDIRALDMDGDGDLDLVIAGQASRNVVWCENPMR